MYAVGTVIDTEFDIIVTDVPIITPNGDVVISSLTFKVSESGPLEKGKDRR